MVAHKITVAVLLLLGYSIEASVIAPEVYPAVAPVAYTRAVPYNVLPFANSVNIFRKTLSAPLVAAYPGIEPAFVRTPFAPIPAEFPHSAHVPFAAHAPPVVPGLRLSSFLPAPFASAPAVAPAIATPHLAPSPFAPAPSHFAPAPSHFAPAPLAPAFGRSLHAVSPGTFPSPVVLGPTPNW